MKNRVATITSHLKAQQRDRKKREICQAFHNKNMKVAVRIRPLKNSEVKSEGKFEGKSLQSNLCSILHVREGNLIFDPVQVKNEFYFHGKRQFHRDITVANKNLSFKFDDVFDDEAQNRDVFERLMKPLVHSLMEGINCSFISYGATGTGKSHTILGNSNERGIAYLTMEYVFFQLNKRVGNEWIYEISVSYLEVYNERVVNLLAKSRPLVVAERDGKVNLIGLTMKKVNNLNEVQKLLMLGNRNRTKNSNSQTHSKQSNTIFQVHINTPNKSFDGDSTVKLLIIELGGSERNASEGIRATEALNFSKPILTLKNCIHRLSEGSKTIPFNESQLTTILKDSFSDECLTVMLFNVSSSLANYGDTYNTLTYANRTQLIGKRVGKIAMGSMKQRVSIESIGPKSNQSYTIFTTKPDTHKTKNMSSAVSTRTVQKSLNGLQDKSNAESKIGDCPMMKTELTELTRWFYEIGTVYDALKTAVEGCCTTISKEKLLELRLRCRENVENCRTLLLSGRGIRMAKVRVKSILEEITKQVNLPPSKVIYWKSRLQICQQQLVNLHRKVKESNFDHVLENYISVKELEATATKAHHITLHIMKINAIYVNKTEIYGYLSVLGKTVESNDLLCQEAYHERQSADINEFDDITFPLYKNWLDGLNSKTSSQTKCNKTASRTSMNLLRRNI